MYIYIYIIRSVVIITIYYNYLFFEKYIEKKKN